MKRGSFLALWLLAHALGLALLGASGCEDTRHRYPDAGQGAGSEVAEEGGSGANDAAGEGSVPDGALDATESIEPDAVSDSSELDGDAGADVADSGGGEQGHNEYDYVAPPGGTTPAALQPNVWLDHLQDDILPFWSMSDALGEPVGNFPTYRGMDGTPQLPTERRPRMLGRQIYLYCMAFMLTGDISLLGYAGAGVDWLMGKGWDEEHGGWHARLDATGNALGSDAKTAQDASYAALGLAAWVFVTRDPVAEEKLLATRDLLLEGPYWDATNGRVKDALDVGLSAEVDLENDNGWELVAQLDPVNAFLLLSQPVLSDSARREQFLGDSRRLAELMVADFLQGGFFWGVHNAKGKYGSKHADFGHNLKAWWMLLQIDKRLTDRPFSALLATHLTAQMERAFDASAGRWGKRPTGSDAVEWGGDWWSWAEADQLAATVNLRGGAWTERLAASSGHWIEDFVDRTREVREVVPSIKADGSWAWNWPDADTAKCNQWKSGFHTVEHAVVMALHGSWLTSTELTLHFAPIGSSVGFQGRPYLFEGDEAGRKPKPTTEVGGRTVAPVEIRYRNLR